LGKLSELFVFKVEGAYRLSFFNFGRFRLYVSPIL